MKRIQMPSSYAVVTEEEKELLGGGGAFAYIKFIKPKQGAKVSADPDDYDFEDEEEDKNSEHNVPNFINVLGRSKALEKMNYYSGKAIVIIDEFENNGFIKGLVEYLF